MAALETYKPHSMACIVNMDISVPHSTAKAVNVNAYCNNGQCASKLIAFVYSWTANILVVHGNGLQPWSLWLERHPEYQCEVFIPNIKLLIYLWAILDVTAPRVCNTTVQLKQHVPCQQLYLRKHGLLQQMKCLLKKQQLYTGHIMTPTLINAWKSYLSGHQQCKSPPYNWKISQLFKFPNKYSGKISETCI